MLTHHRIVIGTSQQMPELADGSVQLMVTSPPYPMIQMWDNLFAKADPKIAALWRKLEEDGKEENVAQIYDAMHDYLGRGLAGNLSGSCGWRHSLHKHRRRNPHASTGNSSFFPNHARVTELCEKIGFTTLPYILWKKPTKKPSYKGKGAFLGSGFLPPNAYVTLTANSFCSLGRAICENFRPKTQAVRQRLHQASARRMVQPNLGA